MSINTDLIRALYKKYAPEKNIPAQTAYINDNYTSQDKFVEDFYKQYNAELTPEIKLFIRQNFGGFGATAEPTIDEKDFDVSIDPESADFVSFGSLSKFEESLIEDKFGTEDNPNLNYFNEDSYENVTIRRGTPSMFQTQVAMYDSYEEKNLGKSLLVDLNITDEQHAQNLQNEIKKFQEPNNPEYNLSEAEIQEINQIKKEVFSEYNIEKETRDNLLFKFTGPVGLAGIQLEAYEKGAKIKLITILKADLIYLVGLKQCQVLVLKPLVSLSMKNLIG